MRLDKTLCHAGWGSRSDIQSFIRQGRVTVSGVAVKQPAFAVSDPHVILLDGKPIDFSVHYSIMLNKPFGVITATEDNISKTVTDLLPKRYRRINMSPVGRLDKDTTGLLILTTDGQLSHRLTAPRYRVPKLYHAKVEGIINPLYIEVFRQGITLPNGSKCRPATLEILKTDQRQNTCEISIVLTEGKFHQVKRMVAACGCGVLTLHRSKIGRLELDPALAPGEFRRLTDQDIVLALQM